MKFCGIKLFTLAFAVSLCTITAGLNAQPDVKWTFTTGGAVYSSPIYDNETIFIGSDDFNLYSLNAETGKINWKFPTSGMIRCRPAVEGGAVYFASDDGNLYSIDSKSGTKLWVLNIGNNIKRILPGLTNPVGDIYWDYMQSSPCFSNGIIYIGSGDSSLYAVEASNGSVKWKVKTGGIIRSSPCVDDVLVYVGSFDGFIYAFNITNGTKVWAFDTHGSEYKHVQPSPRVVEGILYCGSRNPFFYALDAKTGKEIWKQSFDFSWVESSAAIANGKVFVGSSDLNTIYAFNAKNGNVNWALKIKNDSWSSPCYHKGIVYIGLASYANKADTLMGGAILAINASDGTEKWKVSCGITPFIGGVVSSPAVYNDVVFYGSLDGKVYAVKNN
jgi:outer membrane protein assembly factor BamB